MNALLKLVLRQLRRTRRTSITLGLLIVLTAGLANIGLICATGYASNMDRTADELRTEHIALITQRQADGQVIEDALSQDDRVTAIESTPVRTVLGSIDYAGAETSLTLSLLDLDAPSDMGAPRIVRELDQPVSNPVYLPYLLESAGGYALGDEFVVRSIDGELRFHIQGFVESVNLGSIQMGTIGMWLPRAGYEASAGQPGVSDGVMVKAMLTDPADGERVVGEVSGTVADSFRAAGEQPPFMLASAIGMSKLALGFVPSLFAVALIFFAAITLLAVIVVLRFLVKNSIVRDLRGIGTLKAVGFTSGQVMGSYLAFFLTGALLCTIIGVGASYGVLPALAGTLSEQTGLIWEPAFSPFALVALLAAVGLAVAVTVTVAGRRIRRIPPVHALRGGLPTHSFSRNPLPLDKARGPLNVLLGLKSSLRRASQGTAVALVIGLVSLVSVFAAALYTNVLADSTRFANLAIGDFSDVEARASETADRAQTIETVRSQPGVERAYYNDYVDITSDGIAFVVQVTDDYSVQRVSAIYEGRNPVHDNEIAIGGRLAELLGVEVGDTITLHVGSSEQEYVITGLLRLARNVGQFGELTTAAYQRLDPAFVPSGISVYADDGTTAAELLPRLREAGRGSLSLVIDNASNIRGQIDVYSGAAGVLAVAIVGITAAVVTLVILLVVTTTLIEERRPLGIHKAVGFTSRELMTQLCVSYLPPVVTGVLLGCLAGGIIVSPLLGLALSGFGLAKTSFAVDPWLVGGLGVAIIALATALTLWRSRQIGRISTYALVTE